MKARILISILLCAAFGALNAQEKEVQEKQFDRPGYGGQRVNFCLSGGGCGQEAANLFCTNEGYDKATSFTRDPQVGQAVAADNDAVCRGNCDGFRSVTCSREMDPT